MKIFTTIVLTKGKMLNLGSEEIKKAISFIKSLEKSTNVILILQGEFTDKDSALFENLKIKIIKNEKNLGYAGGHNLGIKYAINNGADYILIANHDLKLQNDFLKNMLKPFSDVKMGIVGPRIYDENGRIWALGGNVNKFRFSADLICYGEKDKNINEKYLVPDFISGTILLVSKDVFIRLGLLKEDYFIYYEDVDFSLRAKKAGFKIVINPSAKAVHFASSAVGKNSPLQVYYMARNHLLFLERFAPLSIKIRELIRIPKTIYEAKSKKFELMGIRDYFFRRFGKNENWG
ncbi:MAG: glycosyltransferase family 2 protein [Candidatus Levybacteria bacterium]|nr:glycosyltransferase family 2 protein [Candidatus Levybacteria bacterium]